MCAIIGAYLRNPTASDLETVKRVFLESRIRGMHATGISWVANGSVNTIKEPIPANKFIDKYMGDMTEYLNDGRLIMIGHCRYSTSDLQYNQPIANQSVSVVHNGVVTQEPPSNWETLYNYKCSTRNDTELLLHTIEEDKCVLGKWAQSSLSVIELHEDQEMVFYRNGKRPMWLTSLDNGCIITSTKNVPVRAGVGGETSQIPMNVYNRLGPDLTHKLEKVDIDDAVDYQM